MRDPERIDRITEKLRRAWHEHPDYRLGQLVNNLAGLGCQDVFFHEDTYWERQLDAALQGLDESR